MRNILVIHGPNLNLLGTREVDVYGTVTIRQINNRLKKIADAHKVRLTIMQSSHEGEIVEAIGEARNTFDCIIINPAAYTHTSVAIRDAVSSIDVPVIEAHLSNIYGREEFRHTSLIAPVAKGQISGFGAMSYELALEAAVRMLKKRK
ncbi:MAG: type II 3-dehydroquinate dehydratase [Candidatus Omnitrophota bacterium]